MVADKYILDFLTWCHANPITTSFLLGALTWIAKKTKTKADDDLLYRFKAVLGRADEISRPETR